MSRPSSDPSGDHTFAITPIATVSTCFGGKFAVPRQSGLCPSSWGRLVFHPPFRSREAVRGIDGFSHLWLIFGFHQVRDQGWQPTVRPPRLGGNRRMGLFATRSPFRPNNLGLSLVRLEKVDSDAADGPVLHLGGVDLLDGTPIYDIKPHIPFTENPQDVRSGFAPEAPDQLEVRISPQAAPDLAALPPRAQALIREALSLDPRPAASPCEPDRVFGAELCGRNIRFTIDGRTCTILAVEKEPGEP